MRFDVGRATDRGMIREANQDRLLVHGDLAAVADGMGGHAGGELAAETAVEELRSFGSLTDSADVTAAVLQANRQVLAAAERTGMTNMGTTVVAALMRMDRRSVVVANVGDSRAYLMSGGELDQITRDHSLVEDLLRAGKITEDEARDHPHRNVVTRVLGLDEEPEVDIFELAVGDGDLILLASDGLFNEVDHHVIATILDNADELDEAANRLVERANQNGGNDNITVVIVRFIDDGAVAAPPESAATIAAATVIADDASATVIDGSADGSPAVDGQPAPDVPGQVPVVPLDAVTATEAADSTLSDADDPPTDELPPVVAPRKRRARAFIFLVCLIAIIGLGIGGLVAYGQNAWFVDTVTSQVVIHRGRPGGVLFIEPQAVGPTGIQIGDLTPASRELVAEVPVFGSLEEAERFVDGLSVRENSE